MQLFLTTFFNLTNSFYIEQNLSLWEQSQVCVLNDRYYYRKQIIDIYCFCICECEKLDCLLDWHREEWKIICDYTVYFNKIIFQGIGSHLSWHYILGQSQLYLWCFSVMNVFKIYLMLLENSSNVSSSIDKARSKMVSLTRNSKLRVALSCLLNETCLCEFVCLG